MLISKTAPAPTGPRFIHIGGTKSLGRGSRERRENLKKNKKLLTFPAIFVVIVLLYFGYLQSRAIKIDPLNFDQNPDQRSFPFAWEDPTDLYLMELRTRYNLEEIVSNSKSDLERVEKLCHWVHGLWKHNGRNMPKKSDPISIIEEAKTGKRFRCVEYSIVLSACLNSIGTYRSQESTDFPKKVSYIQCYLYIFCMFILPRAKAILNIPQPTKGSPNLRS